MMYKTLLIDDEPAARINLRQLIETHCPSIKIAAEGTHVAEGIRLIEQHKPDLVFLDVQMPDGTGFDLLSQLTEVQFRVVFVSAYDTFAINAFRYSAVDYLLKPVSPELLVAAVEKVHKPDENRQQKIKILLGNSRQIEKLALPSLDEVYFVKPDDIVRCQSDNNYTRFFLRQGQVILVSRTLKDYEELLEPLGFFRIHKSDVINLKYISKYKRGEGGTVTLDDGTQLEVSRRRKDDFLKAMQG